MKGLESLAELVREGVRQWRFAKGASRQLIANREVSAGLRYVTKSLIFAQRNDTENVLFFKIKVIKTIRNKRVAKVIKMKYYLEVERTFLHETSGC